jgi:hypothetical protein
VTARIASFWAAAGLALTSALACGPALGQGATRPQVAPPVPAGKPPANEPAFMISGWQHQTGQNGVEFYFCRQDLCGRDSKVSYQVLSASARYTLEQFGAEKAKAAEMLRQQMGPGARVSLEPPTEETIGSARVLRSQRVMAGPDGREIHSVSSVIMSRHVISVISSGSDAKLAKGNFALFLIPLLVLSGEARKR